MDIKYWLSFAFHDSMPYNVFYVLYNKYKDISLAWNVSEKELSEIKEISPQKKKKFLSLRNEISPDKVYDDFKTRNIGIVTIESEYYPNELKEIFEPPMVLFYKGNIELLKSSQKLAVVGSRNVSSQGSINLKRIITQLAGNKITIVSGLAAGADTIAHKSALENNLSTIAVIGSGFDYTFPASNKKLYNDIIESNNLILSEYYPSNPPLSHHFPRRNRIVSGLSKGVLVAEAALKSGALISARLCLEQNRELMCIPGAINNPNTQGIYKLLKDGAGIVTEGSDILNYLDWKSENSTENKTKETPLNTDEQIITDLLSRDDLTLDELSEKTNLQFSDLMLSLTTLELSGKVKQIEGDKYTFCGV